MINQHRFSNTFTSFSIIYNCPKSYHISLIRETAILQSGIAETYECPNRRSGLLPDCTSYAKIKALLVSS